MKHFLLTALVVIALATTAFAQKHAGQLEYSFNIGFNSASALGRQGYYAHTEYRTAFNAGVSADYFLSDDWSIKGKLAYDQKGWNRGFIINAEGNNYITTNYHIDYLTVPVLFSWHIFPRKTWYLNFGPYAGFLLSAKETAGGNNVKDLFKTTDIGVAGALGFKFPLSAKTKMFIEVSNLTGLTNVFKHNESELTDAAARSQNASIRNNTGSFNIGLAF